jgi:hypothetical protein
MQETILDPKLELYYLKQAELTEILNKHKLERQHFQIWKRGTDLIISFSNPEVPAETIKLVQQELSNSNYDIQFNQDGTIRQIIIENAFAETSENSQ